MAVQGGFLSSQNLSLPNDKNRYLSTRNEISTGFQRSPKEKEREEEEERRGMSLQNQKAFHTNPKASTPATVTDNNNNNNRGGERHYPYHPSHAFVSSAGQSTASMLAGINRSTTAPGGGTAAAMEIISRGTGSSSL